MGKKKYDRKNARDELHFTKGGDIMNKKQVSEILEALLEIQTLDIQIAELEVSKVYKPHILEEKEKEIKELEQNLADAKEYLKELKVKESATTTDIATVEKRLKRSQEKLSRVASNREYDAIQEEIQKNEELLAQHTEEFYSISDEIEETEKKVAELEKNCETTKQKNTEEIAQIEDELSHLEDNIAVLKNKRKQWEVKTPKRILSTYNRLRKGLNNIAIAKVKKRACGMCYQNLAPQTIQDLIRGDEIVFCPSCGRILVWDPEESPA